MPPRPRRRGGVVGPLILIFLGAVFLLQNAGVLPNDFWVNLWRLWPLILVLVGIELLLANRIPGLALFGLGAIVLLVGAIVMNANLPAPLSGPPVTLSRDTWLGGASQAAVTLRFGVGQLNVAPIAQPRPGQLASMSYQGPPQLAPEPRYTPVQGGVSTLEYQTSGRSGSFLPFADGSSSQARMDVYISPDVPITSFIVQTGATDAHLDLSSLHLNSIDLAVGAATAWVRFPETGVTTAHLSGGASTITLEIPQGVAARIQIHGGLSTLNVDQSRFPQVSDGVYRSSDYDSAQNRIDLTVETGVTTIQVN